VAAGSSTAAFTITTSAVSTSTTATITAAYQGNSQTAALTVAKASIAPVVDVTVSKDSSSAASTITTPTFSTASGNELLLAFINAPTPTSGGTNSSVTSVSNSGQSLTWQLVQRTNVQYGTSEIWRAFSSAALSSITVTAALNQSNPTASITVVTFTGVDTTGTNGSGAIGAVAGANSSYGAPSASLTTTRANSLVYGIGNDWDGDVSRTVGSSQTMVHQFLAPSGDTFWVQRQTNAISAAGTTVSINDTAPADHRYNLSIVEIRTP
jgi:hypothetical protein